MTTKRHAAATKIAANTTGSGLLLSALLSLSSTPGAASGVLGAAVAPLEGTTAMEG